MAGLIFVPLALYLIVASVAVKKSFPCCWQSTAVIVENQPQSPLLYFEII